MNGRVTTTATLLHDDVIDQSDMRRNQKTAHRIWGETASILVGDFLLTRSFHMMIKVGLLPVLDLLGGIATSIVSGEIYQLTVQHTLNVSQETYLNNVLAKTDALFQGACEIGALLTHQPPAGQNALKEYGLYVGKAFQLMDDVMDYQGAPALQGKPQGQDFREGKVTLPLLMAYKCATEKEKIFWKRTIQDLQQEEGDFQHACALLQKTKSLHHTIVLAQDYSQKAAKALAYFPKTSMRLALEETAFFASCRKN